MQQRYYDPIAGRFLSVDPVVTDAATGRSFGRYHYGENNPYKFKDPDGRDPEHHYPAGGLSRTESRAVEAQAAGMALGLVVPGLEAAGLASEGKYVAAAVSLAVDIGPGKVAKVADKIAGSVKGVGRSGKQERLRELAEDSKVSSADRGWIKNEMRHVETGNRTSIRNPRNSRNSPHTDGGTVLAHPQGKRAADGHSYKEAVIQDSDLHKLEHKHQGYR